MSKSVLTALLISLALGLWLWSGQYSSSNDQQSEQPTVVNQQSHPPLSVRIREQQAQPFTREIKLTARTAPNRQVTLRAEIDASVEAIKKERGSWVKKGEVIVYLAKNEREYLLQEAKALVKHRAFNYKAMQNLSKKGYQAKTQIAEAYALLESAKAQVKSAEIMLANTVVHAPFSGILLDRAVEVGDYLTVGSEIAHIIDQNPLLVIGEINELERNYLKLGQTAYVRLVTGETLEGKISLINAQAEEATRTFKIEVTIPNPSGELPAGVTSEIRVPLRTVMAHKVSAALLSLNDQGVLGIKSVDNNNIVQFHPIQLARATAYEIWLAGLPAHLRLITVGQGFVRAGDKVNPVLESQIN